MEAEWKQRDGPFASKTSPKKEQKVRPLAPAYLTNNDLTYFFIISSLLFGSNS